jgi:multidrug resistance efflux pump
MTTKKKLLIIIPIILLLGAAGTGMSYYKSLVGKKDADISTIPTALAKKGDFEILLNEVGTLDALKSQTVVSKTQGKIIKMVPEGSLVKEGDDIVWLDPSDLEKQIKDMENTLKNSQQDLEKTKESQRLQKYQNDMSVEASRLAVENAKLDYSDATIKLAKNQRLYDAQVIPETTLEDAKLRVLSMKASVEKSELSLSQTEETRKSNLISGQIQLAQSEASLKESNRKMEEYKNDIKDTVIKAPGNGIIIYEMMWRGGDRTKLQEGDQIWERMNIAQIPDLSRMINKTMIDEVDISKVKVGQEVRIKLDALSGVQLKGKITKIATLAVDKGAGDAPFWMRKEASGVKAFEVTTEIDPNNFPLRPGMTSKTQILVEKFSNVVYIPREAVIESGSHKYVFVDNKRGGFERKDVKTGKGDSNFVIITSGLQGNEKIYLRDPSKPLKSSEQDARDKKEKESSDSSSPSMPSPAGPVK